MFDSDLDSKATTHVETAAPGGLAEQGSAACVSRLEKVQGAVRTLVRIPPETVSQAVRKTSRDARSRILSRYGKVLRASAFAVSRKRQPRPFCTTSSSSESSLSPSFVISEKNIFRRVPSIKATQAARRYQRFGDLAQRNTLLAHAGFATTIVGLMLESHLKAGNQSIPKDLSKLEYGLSITDPCIDWQTTEDLLLKMHQSLQNARR